MNTRTCSTTTVYREVPFVGTNISYVSSLCFTAAQQLNSTAAVRKAAIMFIRANNSPPNHPHTPHWLLSQQSVVGGQPSNALLTAYSILVCWSVGLSVCLARSQWVSVIYECRSLSPSLDLSPSLSFFMLMISCVCVRRKVMCFAGHRQVCPRIHMYVFCKEQQVSTIVLGRPTAVLL